MSESSLSVSAKEIVPSLKIPQPKGKNGIIGVFGGHRGYVGATYFTGEGALRVGADMVYIFTTPEASDVKLLSPNLIVQPIIDTDYFIEESIKWLEKMNVVIIGPGFRRHMSSFYLFVSLVNTCRMLRKALVIDSSGLNLLAKKLEIIKDYPEPGVILTPNAEEFRLLFGAETKDVSEIIAKLGKTVTVLRKGVVDEAINFHKTIKLPIGGSNRRCMGQGDFLAGAVGTFFGFSLSYAPTKSISQADLNLAVCQGASRLVRRCNERAFAKKGRAMLTSDMIEEISDTFKELFEED